MKKIILFFVFCLFSAPVFAQGALADLQAKFSRTPVAQRPYLHGIKTLVLRPSERFQESVGDWDRTWRWVKGEDTDARVVALGDYLYNMYVSAAEQGRVPVRLDFGFTGVLDPLEIIYCGYKAQEMPALYKKRKADVKNRIAFRFQQNWSLNYDTQNRTNDETENKFLQTLVNSAYGGGRASYVAGAESAYTQGEIEESLAQALGGIEKIDPAEIRVYKVQNLLDKLDNKHASNNNKNVYRPARGECDACAYTFYNLACRHTATAYDGWKVATLYRVYARPKNGARFVQSASGTTFLSPDGELYPEWDYHAAAVLALYKNRQWTLAVQDPLLFTDPVPLAVWGKVFSANKTRFELMPFRRIEEVEQAFVTLPNSQMDNLRQYKPVIVNGVRYEPVPIPPAQAAN